MKESRKPQMRRATIADVAEAAGVSVSTVDRVLNGRNLVRTATAERVLAAAEVSGFYATGIIRQSLGRDRPARTFGFLLQQKSSPFYRLLADALAEVVGELPDLRARAVVQFMEDLSPEAVSAEIRSLGAKVDALAVVAADHPRIGRAIEELGTQGVPTIALISDLTTPARAGYVGIDNWKLGRTAGWAITALARRPGKVAILVGSHRYLCQDSNEMGFRSYFREHAPDFQLLEPFTSLEDARYAEEVTRDLLCRTPDLSGLFMAGGGIAGVLAALRDEDRSRIAGIVTVSNEQTEQTHVGLIDGILTIVLSCPIQNLAKATVRSLATVIAAPADEVKHRQPIRSILPFEIHVAESLV